MVLLDTKTLQSLRYSKQDKHGSEVQVNGPPCAAHLGAPNCVIPNLARNNSG